MKPRFLPENYDIDACLRSIEMAEARREAAVEAYRRYQRVRREAPIPGNWLLLAFVVCALLGAALAYALDLLR